MLPQVLSELLKHSRVYVLCVIAVQEVIQLTQDLVGAAGPSGAESDQQTGEGSVPQAPAAPLRVWKPGDKCLAIWSEDKNYYDATVDEVLEDGSCTVTFDDFGNTDVTQVSLLRSVEAAGTKRGASGDAGPDAKKLMSKKEKLTAEREYKRKKSQKKAQRLKTLEEEREQEKNKWLDFNAKTFTKTSKGKVKKSIFATPDAVEGKVGVGTCGKGGRPMTTYIHQEKWKK